MAPRSLAGYLDDDRLHVGGRGFKADARGMKFGKITQRFRQPVATWRLDTPNVDRRQRHIELERAFEVNTKRIVYARDGLLEQVINADAPGIAAPDRLANGVSPGMPHLNRSFGNIEEHVFGADNRSQSFVAPQREPRAISRPANATDDPLLLFAQ